jgi:hypothetical protein
MAALANLPKVNHGFAKIYLGIPRALVMTNVCRLEMETITANF